MALCDAHFEQLRDKTQQWIDCLDGEDLNSITNQLTRLTWNITAFRVLVEEAYDLASDAPEGCKQLNGLLFRLLQESFLESLLMGLRRLMDSERDGLNGKRGVYSLSALLKDVSEHSHLLTRGAIVRLGPPDGSIQDQRRGVEFIEAWTRSRNQLVDELVSVTENNRKTEDRIGRHVFDGRRRMLEVKFTMAEGLINKKIAHAATPRSRQGFNFDRVHWDDLYGLHAELCKTTHFLQDLISESGMSSLLPMFQGDEFDYLARPIVAEKDLQTLADRWAKLGSEYKSWRHWRPAQAPNCVADGDDSHEWAQIHGRFTNELANERNGSRNSK
jgi:hypothetical protein